MRRLPHSLATALAVALLLTARVGRSNGDGPQESTAAPADAARVPAAGRGALDVGVAGHAFDHLGSLSEQAEAAAASGATIIYATGFGSLGYAGLPKPDRMNEADAAIRAYLRNAKAHGIGLSFGYLCATSIVNLRTFDENWTPEFRGKFSTAPARWLQQDACGAPLASWYGGDYRPACMNNPDWRVYQKSLVRLQIEAGHDGIFFDNPTVHPQGCHCEHYMGQFAASLAGEGARPDVPAAD
jgi:hypothetical protein